MRAGLEQIGAIDHLQHLLHVLLDDQHREPAGADTFHQLEHLLHHDRRQTRRRLVEQQQFRIRHQRAADRAHLLLAARHGAGHLAAPLLHARKQVEHEFQPLGIFGARARHVGAHLQIVVDGEPRKQPAVLRHMGDAETRRCDAPASPARRCLPSRSRPWSGRIRPEITRISVVLPAPLGPITPTASPALTSRLTPNSAWKVP